MCSASVTKGSGVRETGTSSHKRKPLGARLQEAGLISEAQLDLALREQKRQGRLLGEVLIDLGFVAPEVITGALAREARTEVVDLDNALIDGEILNLVDYDVAKQFKLLPLSLSEHVLTIVLADAFNVVAIDHVEKTTGYPVAVVTASETDVLQAITKHYSQGRSINDTIDIIMRDGIMGDASEAATESPMVRLVDQLISLGIKQLATDIHIEPDEKILRVRLRVDGVLRPEVLIPKNIQPALIARLKLMAGLNITEKRAPQDGRIRFTYGESKVDLRVSTLPTNHGESLVLRILDTAAAHLTLNDLGFEAEDRQRFVNMLEQPYGMVLVTGPTGSGKTTTLYSALKQVDSERRSIFTLEDPIEYSMRMIRQTQVNPEVGMDFANGLRSLLRQDPDVVLIGEIRDVETAQIATRAALTGHLVLSTLHTNNAVGVIPRLVDMGVQRYLIPGALSAVIAQRLVRRICKHCKAEVSDPEQLISKYELTDYFDSGATLWCGSGCDACSQTGYKGRQAIYEVLVIDERFHDPILEGAHTGDLNRLAMESGMRPMLVDGIQKALQGITTIQEIVRVVR